MLEAGPSLDPSSLCRRQRPQATKVHRPIERLIPPADEPERHDLIVIDSVGPQVDGPTGRRFLRRSEAGWCGDRGRHAERAFTTRSRGGPQLGQVARHRYARPSPTPALLFFDEVITGFRLGQGGATAWSGVQPDVWAFGKVIGGGLPVGAFGASHEIMANVAPLGPVYQGGTLSGNPLATAAGLAALRQLEPARFEALEATATRLADGLRQAIEGAGVPVQVPRVGPLLSLFFTGTPVRHYDDAKAAADDGPYPAFFHGMLARGIALAPGPYEALFPSLAHADADIDRTVEAAAEVAAELAAHGR